jgi:cold shock CspA family protein
MHISAIEQAGLTMLREGQKDSCDLISGKNGKSAASNIAVID